MFVRMSNALILQDLPLYRTWAQLLVLENRSWRGKYMGQAFAHTMKQPIFLYIGHIGMLGNLTIQIMPSKLFFFLSYLSRKLAAVIEHF